MKNIVSVILTAAAAVSPQFVTALPEEYRALASAILVIVANVYHLYQPSPSGK